MHEVRVDRNIDRPQYSGRTIVMKEYGAFSLDEWAALYQLSFDGVFIADNPLVMGETFVVVYHGDFDKIKTVNEKFPDLIIEREGLSYTC